MVETIIFLGLFGCMLILVVAEIFWELAGY
jgi:hypothetical protein